MKNVIYLGVLVLLLTSTGCIATKDYVLEQTGPLSRRVIDLESRMSALENMVNRIPATLPLSPTDREMLQKAEGDSQKAAGSAQKAEEMAQRAAGSADMATESAKKADEAAIKAQEAAKKGEKLLELGQKK
jgi:hypothetical protein